MANSRELRSRKHRVLSARTLASFSLPWLNGSRKSKARVRVIDFIESLKAADLLSKQLVDGKTSAKAAERDHAELIRCIDTVNRIHALYPVRSEFKVLPNGKISKGLAMLKSRKVEPGDNLLAETILISNLLQWFDEGTLQWFRNCRECKKWFVAGADHQVSCSPKCRQQFASQTESYKERRRKYMKEHRRKERERDKRLLQRARRRK